MRLKEWVYLIFTWICVFGICSMQRRMSLKVILFYCADLEALPFYRTNCLCSWISIINNFVCDAIDLYWMHMYIYPLKLKCLKWFYVTVSSSVQPCEILFKRFDVDVHNNYTVHCALWFLVVPLKKNFISIVSVFPLLWHDRTINLSTNDVSHSISECQDTYITRRKNATVNVVDFSDWTL